MGMIRWVVELDPTNDFQLFIRALESLRDGMETDFRVGCLILHGMSGGLVDDRIDANNVNEVDDVRSSQIHGLRGQGSPSY